MKKSAMVLVCVLLMACWAQARPADPGAAADASAAPADPQSAPPAAPADTSQPVQTGQPTITAPPELPKSPDVRMPGESGFWLGIGASEPTGNPIFDKGRVSGYTDNSLVTMQGRPKSGEQVEIGVALGLHNALVVSGFTTRAAGDFTAPVETVLWGQIYNQGVLVSTNYWLRGLKISYEYLTWPYPVKSRHFRLKTLWQVQYVDALTGFDAPLLPITNASGGPLLNSSGQVISYQTSGSRWIISPTIGLGATEYLSKFVRVQLNGSGFAFPRHWTIWDTDGSINFRLGHFEVGGGVRAFHVKTSTNGSYYLRGTLISPQVFLRWYLK